MHDFKFFRKPLPFYWTHYGEQTNGDGKGMYGVTWKSFLNFCEERLKRGIKTFVVVIETEDNDEYGLDIFEGEPEKLLKIIQDDERISVYFN